jgi:hypothetical protein
MKPKRCSRGTALLFPNLGDRWSEWWTPPPPARPIYPRGKTRYPLYRRLGGPQVLSERDQKISPAPGFDHRTRPARCESLYRLSYPDTHTFIYRCITRRINTSILYTPPYFSCKRYCGSPCLNWSPNTHEYSHVGFYLRKVRRLCIFQHAVALLGDWSPSSQNKRYIKYSIIKRSKFGPSKIRTPS